MKKIAVLLLFLSGISSVSMAQKVASKGEVTFQTSARCGMCKSKIERDLSLSKGVEKAELNLEDKKVTVVYNSKKTNPTKLKKTISKIGYDADDVVANQKSHDALPDCCQKAATAH
jgi:copper chaperone CopZ